MKTLTALYGALIALSVASCGTIRRVPVETQTIYTYIDSTIVSYRDSTIIVEVPRERIVDVVAAYDTLFLETSLAEARSYVDTTTHTLKGTLVNRDTLIEKIVYLPSKEHIVYKDSLVIKEIPYPVEVIKKVTPKWAYASLMINIVIILILSFLIYIKIRH